jgi:hypothetical protein
MREYRGLKYRVHAGKHPMRDEWSPSGELIIDSGEQFEVETFESLGDTLYPTREAAIRAGCEILERWIDEAL